MEMVIFCVKKCHVWESQRQHSVAAREMAQSFESGTFMACVCDQLRDVAAGGEDDHNSNPE